MDVRSILRSLPRRLLGHVQWAPPPWAQAAASAARGAVAQARQNPRATLAGLAAAVAVVGGGHAAWRWYESRPRPELVDVTVGAPARTCYECEPPGTPQPLTLSFSTSAAPLEAVGKPLDAAKAGLRLSPAQAGSWAWTDDHTLVFTPKADWPVGEAFEVALPRGLIAPQLRLAEDTLRFTSPAFTARILSNDFYQDPVQAGDKKVVTTLEFSHPVEAAALEQRVSLAMAERVTDAQERKLDAPAFTVTYDKLRLHAYVHSAQLPVPAKGGRVTVTVAKGLRSARSGNTTDEPLVAETAVPGRDSLALMRTQLQIVRDERDEPSQALLLQTSHSVTEAQMTGKVTAWLLPARHPDAKLQAEWDSVRRNRGQPYAFTAASQVTPAVLAAAQKLELGYVPNERDHVELHSFRFRADPGRAMYVRVEPGLTSFGGYRMPERSDTLLRVPAYPQELRIAQPGSLLALSGKRKLTVFSRDVAAVRVQVSRLLPNQLQHFVSQSYGSLAGPEFGGGLGPNELTETFTSILNLPPLQPGEPHYEALDIGDYLRRPGASRLGVFLLKLAAWDPKTGAPASGGDGGCEDCGYEVRRDDTRLVLVTDLGMLVKRAQDGTQDVFVQSIHGGDPVQGVTIEVLGRNGEPVLREVTDASGHARFRDLSGFRNEKRPVLYLARLGEDLSFLPIDDRARPLDLSRFDIGGVTNVPSPNALSAYLFSDRGIYRPGDEIRAAAIVKSQNWRRLPAGLPLQLTITDPRGSVVRRETLKLSEAGFEEIRHRTRDTSPAGTYGLALAVIRSEGATEQIGTLDVTVREFLPDRLRMTTHFSTESREGWVSPDALAANVTLENLFGTPAANRRIVAQLRLSPAFPQFARWKDYQFRDPQAAKEGFSEALAPATTDDQGRATLTLDLGRFTRATYRAVLNVQGFEADGGRGVTGEAAQLVSSLPWLVGWKVDGDLAYVSRGSDRAARLLAVDPRLESVAASGLTLDHVEQRYVSMLMQQDSGTYRYESRLKETVLSSTPYALPAGGADLPLATATPGRFSYVVRDAQGQVFARIDYTVAGAANLTRSLDRNAELQITLAKADYAPGEEIEMQIQAPYTGTGLITIERERVYAWRWFRSSTTSSIQKIRIPAEALEGNAYVQVTFVRDPSSEEIYVSPLSYGIQPFSIALDARRTAVTLETAQLVKPGEPLAIRYSSTRPSRIALFAVDEGILQVAAYKTPDPLGHFFQKRAHSVLTRQILDLILPEFRESMLAAPGGDEGGALGRNLNPFKRRTDPPVAWWSGIVEADASTRELRYDVPETFNGRLRIMAVAVGPDAVGTAERATTVRGDFVLSPNTPLTVTPGDEFDVSVGVANNVAGSGAAARIDVALAVGAGLQVVGPAKQSLPVAELRESSARFRVRTLDAPGGSELVFTSTLGASRARATATLSIRPATPYATKLHTGSFRGSVDVPLARTLYPAFRTQQATVSPVPLVLAHGLASYLGKYPYSCTEQIVSMALPALVLSNRPEFAKPGAAADPMAGLVDELRLRQTPEGAYTYWAGGVSVNEDASVWAQALLLEAREAGRNVPQDLLDSGNRYLRTLARRDGDTLEQERSSAWAIYLLARQGVVVSNEVAAQQARLARSHAPRWTTDITAGYVAASYELMKQRELADRTLNPLLKGVRAGDDPWHRGLVADAELLYLVSRHFADRLPRLPANLLPELARRIGGGELHSLSAATTILALDAYAKAAGPRAAGTLAVTSLQPQGRTEALRLAEGLFPRVDYPAASTALRLRNDGELPAFYSVEESGFDRQPPATAETQGLEILREYLGSDGKPVTATKVGEELTVRVRFRSVGRPAVGDMVVVDLLPGGFDLVMPPAAQGAGALVAASPAGDTEDEAEGDEYTDDEEGSGDEEGMGDGAGSGNGDCNCAFLWRHPAGFPDYADLREDRVVLYGSAAAGLQEYTYRIKATNAGTFTTPPAYAESMYDGSVRARSIAGRLTVTMP